MNKKLIICFAVASAISIAAMILLGCFYSSMNSTIANIVISITSSLLVTCLSSAFIYIMMSLNQRKMRREYRKVYLDPIVNELYLLFKAIIKAYFKIERLDKNNYKTRTYRDILLEIYCKKEFTDNSIPIEKIVAYVNMIESIGDSSYYNMSLNYNKIKESEFLLTQNEIFKINEIKHIEGTLYNISYWGKDLNFGDAVSEIENLITEADEIKEFKLLLNTKIFSDNKYFAMDF